MQRNLERWSSPLGRFVSELGVETVAVQLSVDPSAVYQWVSGATVPDPQRACQLTVLAEANGFPISLDEIYREFRPAVRVRLARRRGHSSVHRST